jgi:rhodanese-related sulfurtransferase
MTTDTETIGPQSTMQEVLDAFPGAQRALFRGYHIGGCSSCGFQPTETLEQVCQRNDNLDVREVLDHIRNSHEQDARILISPKELSDLLQTDPSVKLLDVRTSQEFEAARIEGSTLMSQSFVQEMMSQWPKDRLFVIIDHQGKQGLDAAAYFLGHGFENVRCLRGGLDAWSQEIDSNVLRYRFE